MTKKIIKETKYCNIINQGKVGDEEYTYTIEKIYIKELKRNEVRFCVYKATRRGNETYIPRSLDVTELELIELIKESIKNKVFSEEFITMLKQEISKA
jgi:IS30 family transposase